MNRKVIIVADCEACPFVIYHADYEGNYECGKASRLIPDTPKIAEFCPLDNYEEPKEYHTGVDKNKPGFGIIEE